MAERVQLQRTKGWRMPANTVKVDRSTRWGNPFEVKEGRGGLRRFSVVNDCVQVNGPCTFREATHWAVLRFSAEVAPLLDLAPLRGKNLACWCKPGHPCHADVLLELANRPD